MMDLMQKITALAKRRGFIFPGSEIYGGLTGFWDYGPLGVELKNNIKREWWKSMVLTREDVVGVDSAIIMNPEVWKVSGHLDAFTDPLVECKVCHVRLRADKVDEIEAHKKSHIENRFYEGKAVEFTPAKQFNLMTEVYLGVTEPKQKAYLRGEITQGAFVNFANVVDSTRVKIPFGIAQIGKAFRNEITPGNFIFRSREFEQMELEFFIKPEEGQADHWLEHWKRERREWYVNLGIKEENLRLREHEQDERAHYAKSAWDIEYNSPFGWAEFEGIHNRGDWDLSRHKLAYKDEREGEEYTPWVIETSGGVDRATLFFLLDSYHEEGDRVILKLHPRLAPVKAAVFPLVGNKPEITDKAQDVYLKLKLELGLPVAWDDRGNIGKRYFAQDEAGTPSCITIDYQTLEDDTVTVRDRDTAAQERINLDKLVDYLQNKLQ